ncbi:hypothetical protein ACKI1I_05345 [Streptomyces turgidiscabies]|uniref:Uncharacterized protein n=1 Tax=Streptomyces turgidiscabies (strain Car8) TaxID=698760 RepID=L7FBC5_STRT8|nr:MULTISPECIES: hypothetical protein [Streptomyces]ELP67960.1 hypothetical protein STRTUCAR8_08886 [Streptomyces turgidiscabies Car8]MDX3491244.1 hypothetical protein [Streptomyces turgidiscabies]GAQ73097.1 hypothetical protein T45_04853 [Streptomyces turgidiscabies]
MTTAGYRSKADAEFFADITDVFRKHPEAAQNYALASLLLEQELKIDFTRQHGTSRIDGDRIVTEFHDRETDPAVIRAHLCIKWELHGQDLECVHWKEAKV